MARAQRGVAFDFDIALVDSAARPNFRVNPTLATGDVKRSIGGGALANLTTLPVVTPAGSRIVKVSLSSAEMDAERTTVQFVDAAGGEWDELILTINTVADIDVDGSVNDVGPLVGDFDGDAGLEGTINEFYRGQFLVFTSGALLRGVARKISGYTASSRNFTFTGAAGAADEPWPSAPANTDRFKIIGMHGT